MDFEGQSKDGILSNNSFKNDSKMTTLTKGFFYQDETESNNVVFPDEQNQMKDQQLTKKELSEVENDKNKKSDFSLSPYQQEESKKAIQLGITFSQQDNPQNNQEEFSMSSSIKRSKKVRKPKHFYFQEPESQQDKKENEEAKKENKEGKQPEYQKQKIGLQNEEEEEQEKRSKSLEQNYCMSKISEQEAEEMYEDNKKEIHKDQYEFDEQQLEENPFKSVYLAIPRGKPSKFIIKRSQNLMNKIYPVFHMYYSHSDEYYISAKQTSNNATATFIISFDQKDFTENGDNYIGKVKSNFIGNTINIYGPGYNPSDVKNKQKTPRQLYGTVHYETNFLGAPKPRQFTAYTLKPEVSYNNNLFGVQLGEEELPLHQLYENDDNKPNISRYHCRKAQWNSEVGAHVLNFNGRVKKASIKNFILDDLTKFQNTESLVFGKLSESEFILDVSNQISPFLALGIALSTFGTKIGCE